MRVTKYFIFTYKNISSEIKLLSNKFLLKSCFIQQLSTGIYVYFPFFLKLINKVIYFIKKEIEKINFVELNLPLLQPCKLFKISERLNKFESELFYIQNDKNLLLSPTSEEVILFLLKNKIKYYNNLSLNFYQINPKFRNELRPNFGLLRCKEFLMKDAYSFTNNIFSYKKIYEKVYNCYILILNRFNINYKIILLKDYLMGSFFSHEFFSSEDFIFNNNLFKFCYLFNYVKNNLFEKNIFFKYYKIFLPNIINFFLFSSYLKINIKNFLKLNIFINNSINNKIFFKFIFFNSILDFKEKFFCKRLINFSELNKFFNINYSYIGLNLNLKIKIFIDKSINKLNFFLISFNKKKYILNIINNYFLKKIIKNKIFSSKKIEIAHIFQLNNYYSKKFDFKIKDKNNNLIYLLMNSYGIGISRLISVIIEQNFDKLGIVLPNFISPFKIVIFSLGYNYINIVKNFTKKIYFFLNINNIEVIIDDRIERLGVLLNDWDLLGVPYKIIISEKNLKKKRIEYIFRKYLFSLFINFFDFKKKFLNKIFKK
ncbi:Prolyl-tRNA synthetase, bacterial type [Candidatus Nasuia deltocephalinicola]|nr:Prolyl-tRNA synthetase, bacterial type [Candidatus Nasuia deltocephalinicola]